MLVNVRVTELRTSCALSENCGVISENCGVIGRFSKIQNGLGK